MTEHATFRAVQPWLPELTAIRRDIHAHPEMGLEERRTAALVAAKLREWGIEVEEGVGGTGVVGTVRGRLPGQRSIGLRADMDALAMTERTGLPHASTHAGVMHGCGHDGHTTMLLGAARYLAENRDFSGVVQLIFQPAEEGRGGALAMLADGLFERFPCDAVFGMHNKPGMPLGSFGICKGAAMAGGSKFFVRFTGTGGHGGSNPHLSTDLSIVAAHFVLGLQTIVGRNISAFEPAVISVGHIGGGDPEACNVMPSEIMVAGTTRHYSDPVKELTERRMRELAHGLAAMHGASVEVTFDWLAEPLINHADETDAAVQAASSVVGAASVDAKLPPTGGGEDFAFMLRRRPGSFIFMGNGTTEEGGGAGLHTPVYDFNDAAIPYGIAYWIELVKQELRVPA
ncbi:amidohydrolase [Alsobacter sp. SYSU M60028]|uniref:Amidohydrolase n=1 Tax=Alsobacter ponti TaxID=2962936 RepID=A0ABT1LH62_9HYPH|nr:amidohydrolase [Alsobacter ponti]